MTADLKTAIAGMLFVLAFGFGIWLSNAGKPLNTAIFTFHKLLAVGAIVLSVVTVYRMLKVVDPGVAQTGVMVAAGVFLLITFASGVWLSIAKSTPPVVLTIHNIVPVLAGLASTGSMYLLARG